MTADELIIEAERLGILLEARGSSLHVEAPPGVLTAELRMALQANKNLMLGLFAPVVYVSLRGGLVVPGAALALALDLEARRIPLRVDPDHQLVIPDDPRLTAIDRAAIARWRLHLGAIVEYRPPDDDRPH